MSTNLTFLPLPPQNDLKKVLVSETLSKQNKNLSDREKYFIFLVIRLSDLLEAFTVAVARAFVYPDLIVVSAHKA